MRVLLSLCAAAALAAGCTNASTLPDDDGLSEGDRTVAGEITAIDLAPMAYDADGRLLIEQDGGGTVTVLVPARWNLCQARSIGNYAEAEIGDRVEARGASVRGGVLPCASASHFIRVD